MTTKRDRLYGGEPLHARRRDQQQRLLVAAREVFAKRGFASASIDDIVSRARVSRTTFYRFFAGKEECMLAVFDEAISRLMETFATAGMQRLTPVEPVPLGHHGRLLVPIPAVRPDLTPPVRPSRLNPPFPPVLCASMRRLVRLRTPVSRKIWYGKVPNYGENASPILLCSG